MITPDDLNLINASNSERRKLADTTLSQVHHDYLENLVIYNRLLKQRNSLLKSWQERGTFDAILLETYDSENGWTGYRSSINTGVTFLVNYWRGCNIIMRSYARAMRPVDLDVQVRDDSKHLL